MVTLFPKIHGGSFEIGTDTLKVGPLLSVAMTCLGWRAGLLSSTLLLPYSYSCDNDFPSPLFHCHFNSFVIHTPLNCSEGASEKLSQPMVTNLTFLHMCRFTNCSSFSTIYRYIERNSAKNYQKRQIWCFLPKSYPKDED